MTARSSGSFLGTYRGLIEDSQKRSKPETKLRQKKPPEFLLLLRFRDRGKKSYPRYGIGGGCINGFSYWGVLGKTQSYGRLNQERPRCKIDRPLKLRVRLSPSRQEGGPPLSICEKERQLKNRAIGTYSPQEYTFSVEKTSSYWTEEGRRRQKTCYLPMSVLKAEGDATAEFRVRGLRKICSKKGWGR